MGYLAARYRALPDLRCFDFARRTIEPDTQIRSDFSHGVTDLLVRLPFRFGRKPATWIKMYLLVEHLSAHQRHIVPRSLGYALEAYRLQERRWLEKHESLQRFMYEAVVPIAIYTGERTWQAPTRFRELVKGGEAFAAFIPSSEPLFLSLPGAWPPPSRTILQAREHVLPIPCSCLRLGGSSSLQTRAAVLQIGPST